MTDVDPPDAPFEQFWADAQKPNWSDKSETSRRRMQWWRDAKFGMFVHWDPSSLAASEISWSKQFYDDNGEHLLDNPRPTPALYGIEEHRIWFDWFKPAVPRDVYDNLHRSFYPGMFDADKFVATAKHAGMKYLIQVSKHHNGFCMWDTKFTDYNVMNTPFHRDVLGEMSRACDRAGIKFGIYYSQRDWRHPDYGPERMAKYNEYMFNQVQELLISYPNISVIFFDCEQYYPWEMWDGKKLFRMIHRLRPDIIINDRCGVPADWATPEQSIGTYNLERDWESCMTFTGFWSWHGFQAPVISYEECMRILLQCVGGNGNLLMNVGPLPTGQIDPREAERLSRVGTWLSKNGESIYGTRGGPYPPGDYGVCVHKGDTIYLHVFQWADGALKFPSLRRRVLSARVLSGGNAVIQETADAFEVFVAPSDRTELDTIVVLELASV
ncbi:MAG: Alpha-L-fucosidase [Verrucomicrobia bacterium]|nr:Alpha-L-fucosidase [Verrucomicrobiota bacterium]